MAARSSAVLDVEELVDHAVVMRVVRADEICNTPRGDPEAARDGREHRREDPALPKADG